MLGATLMAVLLNKSRQLRLSGASETRQKIEDGNSHSVADCERLAVDCHRLHVAPLGRLALPRHRPALLGTVSGSFSDLGRDRWLPSWPPWLLLRGLAFLAGTLHRLGLLACRRGGRGVGRAVERPGSDPLCDGGRLFCPGFDELRSGHASRGRQGRRRAGLRTGRMAGRSARLNDRGRAGRGATSGRGRELVRGQRCSCARHTRRASSAAVAPSRRAGWLFFIFSVRGLRCS